MDAALILARWAQMIAAMAVFGAPLFYLTGPRETAPPSARPMLIIAALAGAVATAVWLLTRIQDLGGWPVLADVVLGAQFGRAASLRLAAFVVVAGLAMVRARWAVVLLAGTVAAASLAWTGHGAADDGLRGAIHLTADVVHTLSAAAWLGALVPLLILVARAHDPMFAAAAHESLRRFSGIGPTLVGALLASGLVNAWFLVGPGHVAMLAATPYGAALLVKLALFVGMLGLAGLNRWVLSPRLATRGLAICLSLEIGAGAVVLAVVAYLGTLIPPVSG
jgi:putative copper resistance protein D